MGKYCEIFDSQIQKFRTLKEEKDKRIRELESSWLMYKELMWAKQQIIDIFLENVMELRSNPDYKKAQELRSAYLSAKKAYESEEQNKGEIETQSDYLKICENLKVFATSMKKNWDSLVNKMLTEWKTPSEINETLYHKWRDILTFFKNFCSWWSNNIYQEKEKNNSIIIKQLWLKKVFNNIYRECIIFSDKHKNPQKQWVEYFNFMVETFKNIESTIERFKDTWFSAEWKDEDTLLI